MNADARDIADAVYDEEEDVVDAGDADAEVDAGANAGANAGINAGTNAGAAVTAGTNQPPPSLPPGVHQNMIVVFFTLVIDLIGFTAILPLIPSMLEYYGKEDQVS